MDGTRCLRDPAHCCFLDKHFRERPDRIFGLGFLDIANKAEDKNDPKNDRTIYKLAQSKCDTAGDEQNINERLVELQKKSLPRRRAAFFRHFIGTVLL